MQPHRRLLEPDRSTQHRLGRLRIVIVAGGIACVARGRGISLPSIGAIIVSGLRSRVITALEANRARCIKRRSQRVVERTHSHLVTGTHTAPGTHDVRTLD
jgi:hypothetical protein